MLSLLLVPVGGATADPLIASADPGRRLARYYSVAANYARVKREVLRWHGTTRNGCVAFVSTALREVGVDIPERGVRNGYGISRITFTLSNYLEHELGWERVAHAAALRGGDVVFTTGYPDHVFVFHAWADRRRWVAVVIDNQVFLGARALFPAATSTVAGFAYALRPQSRRPATGLDHEQRAPVVESLPTSSASSSRDRGAPAGNPFGKSSANLTKASQLIQMDRPKAEVYARAAGLPTQEARSRRWQWHRRRGRPCRTTIHRRRKGARRPL
jgi:hypothetical protein